MYSWQVDTITGIVEFQEHTLSQHIEVMKEDFPDDKSRRKKHE